MTDFVGLLLARSVNPRPDAYPPTLQAINQEGSSGAVLTRLIDSGADIMARSEYDGETVLHRIAAIADEGDLVDVGLRLGAAIEDRDRHGRTPLLVAARGGNLDTFVRLVERGADLDARDNDDSSGDDLLPNDADGNAVRSYLAGR